MRRYRERARAGCARFSRSVGVARNAFGLPADKRVGVRKSELEKRLREYGWWLDRQGGRHEVWTNGKLTEAVPRHREIDEHTARSILRKAETSPGQGARR